MAGAAVILLTAIAPLAWGTTYVVTSELLPEGYPLFSAMIRALPAGIIGLVFTRRLPRGGWWWKAVVLGMLNIGAFFPLLFAAAYRLPGGVASALGATQPLIVALLAVIVLRERLSGWRLGWGFIGLAGVSLVVLRSTAVLDATGVAAGLASAAAMAAGVTLTKRWGRPPGVGPVALAGWQLTAGGLFLLPVTLLLEGIPPHLDLPAVAGYAWLGTVGGLAAYVIWFWGIGRIPVAAVAVLGLLSPLVAAALGALLLGQVLGPWQVVGFGLSLTAIVAAQLPAPPGAMPSTTAARGRPLIPAASQTASDK